MAIAPFKIFSNLILSSTVAEIMLWGGLCVAANGLVLFLIMKTDENFLEKELQYSRLRAENLKKTASIEGAMVVSGNIGTLPMLPFMGGAGPITWRQLQTFYRMKLSLIFQAVIYFAIIAFMICLDVDKNVARYRFSVVITMLSMVTFSAALSMPMGFHTDTMNMEIFKSLPFSRTRIAVGQLLGPVLVLALLQYAVIAVFMFASLEYLAYWFAAAMFAPLVSTVLLSVINSLSLVYPKRPDDGVVKQLENVGHILVFVCLMFFIGIAIVGLLAAVGGLAYFVTHNAFVTLASCWLVMLLASATGVWLTGWAFERFDVSKNRM